MKKYASLKSKIIFLIITSYLFGSCVKDTCRQSYKYTWFEPLYKTTAQVRANIKSNAAHDIRQPGKMVVLGNYIFLNEINEGIHVIDNSNTSSPKNIAFITIPGNVDIALKGNTLYADLYTDLVTIDVSNPLNIVVKKFTNGVFPQRLYANSYLPTDSSEIIFEWRRHDTTVIGNCMGNLAPEPLTTSGTFYVGAPCVSQTGSYANSPVGITGSMSRFSIINNYLYTLDQAYVNIFDISNANEPSFINKTSVSWDIETIYPVKDKLFIGSTGGMYIFEVNPNPSNPKLAGQFVHARTCDPVIADENYAYVTLHSGTTCLGYTNELDIVKLNNFTDAELVKVYSLTSPQGLSKDGNILFICDGTDGLKVYDASDVMNLSLIKQFSDLETYDVIAYNKVALLVAKDGLYEYDYSDENNIHLLSKINIIQ